MCDIQNNTLTSAAPWTDLFVGPVWCLRYNYIHFHTAYQYSCFPWEETVRPRLHFTSDSILDVLWYPWLTRNQHTSLDEMNFKHDTEVVTSRARYVETTKFICKVIYSYSTDEITEASKVKKKQYSKWFCFIHLKWMRPSNLTLCSLYVMQKDNALRSASRL